MAGTWVVQMPSFEINELIQRGIGDFWPEVDGRSSAPVQTGDRVIVWQMGDKDEAGVVGLGVFTGEPTNQRRPRSYRDLDGPQTERRCWKIEFTHWFPGDMVLRDDLRPDPLFDDFLLFKQGGARGSNVKAVTDAQWDALLERAPSWGPVDSPTHHYVVQIRIPCDAMREPDARFEAVRQIAQADPFGWDIDVWRAGATSNPDDVAWAESAATADSWVVWTEEVRARTALDGLGVVLDVGARTAVPDAASLVFEAAPTT